MNDLIGSLLLCGERTAYFYFGKQVAENTEYCYSMNTLFILSIFRCISLLVGADFTMVII